MSTNIQEFRSEVILHKKFYNILNITADIVTLVIKFSDDFMNPFNTNKAVS